MATEVCRLRTVARLSFNHGKYLFSSINGSRPLLSCVPATVVRFERDAHTQNITKNMQYISNDNVKLKLNPNTMELTGASMRCMDKPLCVMMNFMMAPPKAVLKYADLYLSRGIDVIAVSCTPWQLLWPVKGSQELSARLLKFLEVNGVGCSHPLVVHGFSVGAYVWAELLVHTTKNKERYQPVLDRINAQVWDSGADIHEIPVGFPTAVFPRNKFLQESFRTYIKAHMKIFHNVATKHYMKATEVFHANPCKAPALFLVSKTDPIGAEKRSRTAAAAWEKNGIKCHVKCWDRSPHVQHYLRHPEEYRATLYSHLEQAGVFNNK